MRIQILISGFIGLKRPVSAPKGQFTLTGDKLFTQEPSEHNLNQSSPNEYLFQSTNGLTPAQGLKSVLEIMDSDRIGLTGVLYFTHQNSPKFGAKTLNLELIIAKLMERIVKSGVKDTGSIQMLNFHNQLLSRIIRHFRNKKGSGAPFSKVPIINGPGKPSPFILKIEISKVLHLA